MPGFMEKSEPEAVLLACSASRRTWLHTYADSHNNHGWSIRIPETHRRSPGTFFHLTCRLSLMFFAKHKEPQADLKHGVYRMLTVPIAAYMNSLPQANRRTFYANIRDFFAIFCKLPALVPPGFLCPPLNYFKMPLYPDILF